MKITRLVKQESSNPQRDPTEDKRDVEVAFKAEIILARAAAAEALEEQYASEDRLSAKDLVLQPSE